MYICLSKVVIEKNEGTMDGGREGGIKRRGKKERKKEVMGGWGMREMGWGERERRGERKEGNRKCIAECQPCVDANIHSESTLKFPSVL